MSPDQSPFLRTLHRLRAAFWRRRFLRGLVRTLWLTLLVPTIVLVGYLWLGWRVAWYEWMSVAAFVAAISLIWAARPLRLHRMVHRLDRLLGARARLITAFEVSQTGTLAANPVTEHLLHDSVNLSVDARQRVRLFDRGFWVEMNTLIAVAGLLGALLMFDALTTNIPNATPLDLPPLGQEPSAEDIDPLNAQLQPPPFQPPQLSAAQVQAALDALAEALGDQAVTRAAAEAIEQGDLAGAAEELRRVADQLEGLSEQARQQLGESLQEAADAMGGDVPGFTEPLQSGSQSLQGDDLSGAAQALEELAETLDQLDGQPGESGAQPGDQPGESQSEGDAPQEPGDSEAGAGDGAGDGEGGEGDSGAGDQTERLPIDGEPLELESESDLEERVLQPGELDADAGDRRTEDSPFARQPLNAGGEELGPDPLTYPWQQRDVVRKYFTPE